MKKQTALQDGFLARARQKNCPVTVFLVNGFQIRGSIAGYDPFTVVVMSDGKQNLIYKHAISTIAPMHPLVWEDEEA